MKNHKLFLNAGLLGAALIATAPATFAQSRNDVREQRQDVRQAQKNVRNQKRDVRRSDTPAQRAEQQRQLRAAQEKLRRERQDLNREKNQRNAKTNYRYNGNTRYVPNTRYNGSTRYSANRTLEGVVTSDFRGNGFAFRASNGQQFTVQVRGGEPRGISRGDRVRVYGSSDNGIFHAQNLAIVRNR